MPSQDDHLRPQYHFYPPANWLNDPNGLVYYSGEYHIFYQYNSDVYATGNAFLEAMHWAHAVSSDLLNWQHLPIALSPDVRGAIFSGSAVIDWHNTAGFGEEAMVAVFTHDLRRHESQSLAYSTDRGRTWTKYSGNPVIPGRSSRPNFRDPKVIWYDENGSGYWVMILAAGDDILFFTSPDLIHWKRSGTFGAEHGSNVGVWETPDLFKLPVAGGPEARWVLTIGVGDGGPGGRSGMQYFVGHFDGETFTSENPKATILWADYGADYYAAQSWGDEPNGRRLMAGWMSNWQYAHVVPTFTWRGAFSLPRELTLKRTTDGIRVFNRPVSELQALRGQHYQWQNETVAPGNDMLANIRGDTFEIIAELQTNSEVGCFGLRVRVGDGEHTSVGYDMKQQKMFVDRTHSGQGSFNTKSAQAHFAAMTPVAGIVRLQIFVDRSSVEAFGNDGLVTISESIFPSGQSQGLELFTEGGNVSLNSLDIYQLSPVNFSVSDEALRSYIR